MFLEKSKKLDGTKLIRNMSGFMGKQRLKFICLFRARLRHVLVRLIGSLGLVLGVGVFSVLNHRF